MEKKRGLGRSFKEVLSSPADWMFNEDLQVFFCPVNALEPNPYQPRQIMEGEELEVLAASVAEKGVLQPLLVAKAEKEGFYTIIAGERRWRAAVKAGLKEVPVLLKDMSPSELVEVALVENIQRKDLSCIEEALAYLRLQDEFGLSQEEIAKRVGKSRSAIANSLRLLSLPKTIQEDVLNGKLSMGHARALLGLPSEELQLKLRDEIIRKGLSVRAVEDIVYKRSQAVSMEKEEVPAVTPFGLIEDLLRKSLGLNVRIKSRNQSSGHVLISFRSQEELDKLVDIIKALTVSQQGDGHENSSH